MASADEVGTPSEIRIVIADDYQPFRQGLQRVIDAEPDMTVIAAVGDGPPRWRRSPIGAGCRRADVRMPGLDGIWPVACSSNRLGVRSVIVTLHWDRVVFDLAIAAGVSRCWREPRYRNRRSRPHRRPRPDLPRSTLPDGFAGRTKPGAAPANQPL